VNLGPPKQHTVRHWLLAVLLTVALYGGTIHLFEIREPQREGLVQRRASRVVSLPDPLQRGGRHQAWQARVLAWLDLRDPTILSLPHPTRGFSGIRRDDFVRPVQDTPMAVHAIESDTFPELAEFAIIDEFQDLDQALLEARRISAPALSYDAPAELSRQVHWLNASGTIQTDIPALDLEALSEGQTVTGNSVLLLQSDPEMVRVRLVRSCGNAVLDQLAVEHLREKVILTQDAVPLGTEARPLKQTMRHLYIVWRFHPKISDRRGIDSDIWHRKQDIWHDLDWY